MMQSQRSLCSHLKLSISFTGSTIRLVRFHQLHDIFLRFLAEGLCTFQFSPDQTYALPSICLCLNSFYQFPQWNSPTSSRIRREPHECRCLPNSSLYSTLRRVKLAACFSLRISLYLYIDNTSPSNT